MDLTTAYTLISELSSLRDTLAGKSKEGSLALEPLERLTNTVQAIAVWYGHHSDVPEAAVEQLRLEFSRINSGMGVREVSDDVSSLTTTSYPRTGV